MRLLDLFQFLTSVPNHIDPWFDSSKTRGELAPTLPEVSGVGQGGGGEGRESFNYKSELYQKKYFYEGPPIYTNTFERNMK